MMFVISANVMAAVSSVECKVNGVQQKVKKLQHTLMGMQKKCTRLPF